MLVACLGYRLCSFLGNKKFSCDNCGFGSRLNVIKNSKDEIHVVELRVVY